MANFLSPMFNDQTFTANGDPAVGYKVNTYQAGTSTPAATYTTEGGSTPQDNPIVLNARGAPDNVIWLAQGVSYKFVLTDANDVVIDTFDDIGGINDTSVSSGEWTASGYTPTYISTTSFSVSGDKTGDLLVGRRIRSTNTGGTTYSLITASSYSSGTGLTTVAVSNDSGALDVGLSAVDLAILTPDNPSVPNSQETRQALGLGYGADIASASTLPLAGRTGEIVRVTGTTAVTATDLENGGLAWIYAVAALPLTYNATTMPVAGGASYTCSAGDWIQMARDGNGTLTVRVFKQDGTPFALTDSSVTTAKINDAAVTAPKLSGAQTGSAPIFADRAWAFFNGNTAGTNAPTAGGNISTIQKLATGQYRATFSTAMPDENYGVTGSVTSAVTGTISVISRATGSFDFYTLGGTSVATDFSGVTIKVIR